MASIRRAALPKASIDSVLFGGVVNDRHSARRRRLDGIVEDAIELILPLFRLVRRPRIDVDDCAKYRPESEADRFRLQWRDLDAPTAMPA
jgi:hypothetical protein